MSDLEQRINDNFQEIAADIKQLRLNDGDLSSLTTDTQLSLVAAVNEVRELANSANGALIAANNLSDVANVTTARTNLSVNSTAETTAAIATAVAGVTLGGLGGIDQVALDNAITNLVGTAPAILDTFQEVAAKLADDDNAFAALTAAVSNKVSYAAAQTLDTAQKLQACTNIGIGNPDFDYKAAYVATRDAV